MTFTLPESKLPLDLDFDPHHLRERFEQDKQARLRKDQLAQFQGLADVLEVGDRDPFSEPITREPVTEDLDVLVLGGGFGGLTAGAYLMQNGITNFRMVEYGGDYGGTWYWNRYPGVQCDIESHIYMPLLEETGYVPSQRYADGSEIFEHAQRIGRHYDLYSRTYFQTRATHAEWDEEQQRWEVTTDRGDRFRAKFFMRCNGALTKPQLPRVPGIGDFRGKIFHTSRWDYDYTGGSQAGDLHKLRDKRVAVVGPAPPASRRYRTSPPTPNTSWWCSGPRAWCGRATTARRTRTGRRHWAAAGSTSGTTTSTASSAATRSRATTSTTAGHICSRP